MAQCEEQQWWVYIIETDKGKLYTGITVDVERRWQEHSAVANGNTKARGAKFFRTQSPQKILYRQAFLSRSEASKQEALIKSKTHAEKLQLCRQFLFPEDK